MLGCLIEKQRTTPDAYPLSLNALRLACNQATNRDPVVEYDEPAIREALHRLARRRFTRLASGQGSRAAKYRHLLDDAFGLEGPEQALLAVLMLRGPQTPGELRQRSERMHRWVDAPAFEEALERLLARGLVVRLGRRPGQKEERFAHRLGGEQPPGSPSAADGEAPARADGETPGAGTDRLTALEAEVAALRAEVEELRGRLPGDDARAAT